MQAQETKAQPTSVDFREIVTDKKEIAALAAIVDKLGEWAQRNSASYITVQSYTVKGLTSKVQGKARRSGYAFIIDEAEERCASLDGYRDYAAGDRAVKAWDK